MCSRKFNSFSSYLAVFRVALFDKLNLSNSFSCPSLSSGSVFIELKSLENFDNTRLVAAVFILRLLSKRKPYVARFGLFQTFREKDYDVLVRVDLHNSTLFQFVELLAYDILPFLPKADLIASASKKKNGFLVNFIILDLSFLRVVETHSTFFKWHDRVKIQFFLPASNRVFLQLLVGLFKLNTNLLD